MARVTLLDAGPLVALLDRREQAHAWCAAQVKSLRPPLLTCDPVITEACYLLAGLPRATAQISAWLSAEFIQRHAVTTSQVRRAFHLMETYATVPMSFADACLVVMAEDIEGAMTFTLDRDFSVYRFHGDRPIPLIAPFLSCPP